MATSIWTVVVAAGEGRRFGGPKQFELIDGRPILAWAIGAARPVSEGIVLVVPEPRCKDPELLELADVVVAGGAHRSASVRAGLSAVPDDVEIILVHDAARPGASRSLFDAVIGAVRGGADGAIPGVVMSDTIKRIDSNGLVLETLDRSELIGVQTPQAFRAEILRKAHDHDGQATDDAALLESIGARVIVVPGEATNLKVTEPGDVEHLRFLMSQAKSVPAQSNQAQSNQDRLGQ